MDLIKIGIIQKPHGVKGEVKVYPTTDFIKERFQKGNHIEMKLNNKTLNLEIESSRMHQQSILVKFVGLDSLNDVEAFHKGELFVTKDALHELPEDNYYFVDLEQCHVFVDDKEIGVVSEIIDTPAHPVLRVETLERDVLVPFVERFIKSVSIEDKRIDINWMEGL